jgi:hypothetical protein
VGIICIGLHSMLPSVQFDCELGAWISEIRHILPDWVLSTKPPGQVEFSQASPESSFSVGHLLLQSARNSGPTPEHPPPHPTLSAPRDGEGKWIIR